MYLHAIWVHGLADVKVVILEGSDNLLGVASGTGLKLLDSSVVGTVVLHGLLDLLHVGLKVTEVCLLVELGVGEAERVDDIENGLGTILGVLSGLLGGCVGASVDLDGTKGDVTAVGLVDDTVNFLEVEGVGDKLVTGDDVLRGKMSVEVKVGSDCGRGLVSCRRDLRISSPRA